MCPTESPARWRQRRPANVAVLMGLLGLLALGLASGCSADPDDQAEPTTSATATSGTVSSGTATSTTAPESSANTVTVTVSVTGGKVSPSGLRVDVPLGATVSIEVTTDEADELHVHGYDLSEPMEPGQPAQVEFTADEVGLFEVETHDSGLLLAQLAVR